MRENESMSKWPPDGGSIITPIIMQHTPTQDRIDTLLDKVSQTQTSASKEIFRKKKQDMNQVRSNNLGEP